jgi:hypothetical protein
MNYFERMGKRRNRIETMSKIWTSDEIRTYNETGVFPERICPICLTESMINREPTVLECSRCGRLKG